MVKRFDISLNMSYMIRKQAWKSNYIFINKVFLFNLISNFNSIILVFKAILFYLKFLKFLHEQIKFKDRKRKLT
jgi:hypothetical protein